MKPTINLMLRDRINRTIIVFVVIFCFGCKNKYEAVSLTSRQINFEKIRFELQFKTRYKGGWKAFENFVTNQTDCVKGLYPEIGGVDLLFTIAPDGTTRKFSITPAETFSSNQSIDSLCWLKFQNMPGWVADTSIKEDFSFGIKVLMCYYQDCK
jgi:hypothetical protein